MGARAWLLLWLLACGGVAQADVFRPAYLEVHESGFERYEVMWKLPLQGDLRPAVQVRFPPGTIQLTPAQQLITATTYAERWHISRPGGLAGQTLGIQGIAVGVTDVIVRVERLDGTSQVERLLPGRPEFTVQSATNAVEIARAYLSLGVRHILGGFDHLLF